LRQLLFRQRDLNWRQGQRNGSHSGALIMAGLALTVDAQHRGLSRVNRGKQMVVIAFERDLVKILTNSHIANLGEVPRSGQMRAQTQVTMHSIRIDAEEPTNRR